PLRDIQSEFTSTPVRAYAAAILAARPRSQAGASLQALVRGWDGTLATDSAAAAAYEGWIVHMIDRTFHDKLGDAVYLDYLGNGRPTFALYRLVSRPTDPWFSSLGDPAVHGRDDVSSLRSEERRVGKEGSSQWSP